MAKPVQLDANGYRKFGMRDKLAYAAGDFGCNMSFALKSYLTIFWTQYMGIDEILMASLLLLVQIWDAINDPVIGAMIDADKRQYKRNKFLTYIWVGSIGLVVAGAACFIPFKGAPAMVKNILFVAGYILWDAFYTVANVPYGSMMSLITTDPGDRAELSTFRSAGAMVAGILTGSMIPALIYGSDNELRGDVIFWIALFMGVLGFLFFQFMIRNTVIRVDTSINLNEDAPKFNIFKAVGNFVKNRAALGCTLAAFFSMACMYAGQTATTIVWQAYFKNAQISGLISMLSYFGIFLWMPFVRKLVAKFGKKELSVFAGFWALACYAMMCILPITPDAKGMWIWTACNIVNALGAGITSCLTWTLIADAIDYNEWKFGVRDEGTTYALYSFFRKLAQGVGPSLGLVVAVTMGYDAALGAAQPMEIAATMRYLVPGINIVSSIGTIICMGLIFPLGKKTLAAMEADLAARKAN